MKLQTTTKIVFSLLFFATIFSSTITAQESITAAEWQEDLRQLQKTVHADFPFLFKKVTAQEFDTEVDKLYSEIPALEAHELPVAFSRIVSLFKYGHTQIPFSTVAKEHVLPINLYQFTDGIFIEGAHKDYTKTVGAKVIAIEGVAIDKVLEMIRPVVPVENEQYFKAFGLRFVTAPTVLHAQGVTSTFKTTISVTLEKDGQTFEQKFNAVPLKDRSTAYNLTVVNEEWVSARNQSVTPLHLKYLNDRIYYFEYLEASKTVYARQSQVYNEKEGEDLAAFYKRLFQFIEENDVDRLVYDVRHNGGGNNFLNKPLITGVIETKKINQKGKFFVITGRRTFSACQNLVNRLDNYTNVLFVGEPTSENINFYGDSKPVILSNSKLTAYISWAWWQDKAPWENAAWMAPDIAVAMSFEEYRTNRDPIVAAALNYIIDPTLVDPMDHLTKLFMKQDFVTFEKDLTAMVKDKRYANVDFEVRMDQIGTLLTQQQNLEGAGYLFTLNTRLFPKSVGSLISLAKFMITANKQSDAKAYLKKAEALNPKGNQAQEIEKLLATLK